MTIRLLPLVLVLAAASALAGCSDGNDNTPAASPSGRWSVDDARAFDEFPLFWAGEAYEGALLSSILRTSYTSADFPGARVDENSVAFLYGTCDLPESGDGGCPPPYQVIIQPACLLPPGLVVRDFVEETTVRGAPAELFHDGGQVTLWTQNIAINIFAPDRAEVLALAGALVPANARAALHGDDFAPRDSDVC